MTVKATAFYQQLLFDEFVGQYSQHLPKTHLFELSLPWLIATECLLRATNKQVIVHCLFEGEPENSSRLIVAWPLLHITAKKTKKITIQSLSSCYSTIAEPFYFTPPMAHQLSQLVFYVARENTWTSMLLGPLDDDVFGQTIDRYFPHKRLFLTSENCYQSKLTSFSDYYQQLPSQLINTVKRRSKKLNAFNYYHTEIISVQNDIIKALVTYRHIYQKSWKGHELSYRFIEQVCVLASVEDKCRLGVLWVNEKPVAVQIWFIQEDEQRQRTASIFKLAYDPDYQKFSVGSILSMALFEYVITQDQVNTIEFGMGSEPYKKDWLKEQKFRQTYQVFNCDNIYGKLANIRFAVLPRLAHRLIRKRRNDTEPNN